jgi:cytochrome bd-type quinol oxidase subunit 2
MAFITILSLILGSITQAISSAIAAVFLLIVFLLVMPIKVGYKSWKLLKTNVSDFDRRG